ncbi:hypothetical protein [Marinomonas fungiae]|uniref:hypothetical protein n=1 Tax=Marinomonas fungiae TaxID=1137284 RepID=UPI003A93CB4B
MFASIQSTLLNGFYCRVKAEPVKEYSDAKVYELVGSSVPNDIVKKVEGKGVGAYRHIAIDNNGTGYLYDKEKEKLAGNLGTCTLDLD